MVKWTLYLLSFIIGGILLSFELYSVKIVEPYFGHSFEVWASIIGSTMLGMILGYFWSQKIIQKPGLSKNLVKLLFTLFLLLGALPFYSKGLMHLTLNLSLIPGTLISALIINVPLFTLVSVFSPMIIHLVTAHYSDTGNSSGIIYGLSTFGGVVFLVVGGVLLLPGIGLTNTILFSAFMLLVSASLYYMLNKKNINIRAGE